MKLVRSLLVAGLTLAALALYAMPAVAAGAGDTALLDQYEETVPTSQGTKGGGGSGGGGTHPLAGPVKQGLYAALGKHDAAVLEEVATSPRFGAPQSQLGSSEGSGSALQPSGGNVISDALSTLSDGGDSHLSVMAVLLGIITGSAILAAALRRRPTA